MYIIDKICVVLLLEKLEIIGKNSPQSDDPTWLADVNHIDSIDFQDKKISSVKQDKFSTIRQVTELFPPHFPKLLLLVVAGAELQRLLTRHQLHFQQLARQVPAQESADSFLFSSE